MFEWLKKFDKILVTGPQRSGTRICAQMIAHDTGYTFIGEKKIYIDSLYILFSLIKNKTKMVIQCPALCRNIHKFSNKNTAIIFMKRDIKDIISSQRRIDWNWEKLELIRYDRTEGVISEIKYSYWQNNQKKKIQNAFEIEYESLSENPFWVPENLRRNFKADQTSIVKNKPDSILKFFPIRNPDIFYCEKPDKDSAVLVKATQTPKELNATGCLIWNLCDGKLTYREILQKLKEHFDDVDEKRLTCDLDVFINGLVSDGFLRLSPGDDNN